MAHYYLGNLLYDKKQYESAIAHWEKAVEQKDGLALAHRNLAIACYNKLQDLSLIHISLDPFAYSRVLSRARACSSIRLIRSRPVSPVHSSLPKVSITKEG